jgi:DNA mismatch endonuclease, patch repair protein
MQRNAARDKRTQRKLRQTGWRVMVIWECQISRSREEQLRRKIVAFLEKDVERAPKKTI